MSPLLRPALTSLGAAVLCVLSATAARADVFVVVPGGQAAVEGNSSNAFPFNATSQRYQQVYAGQAFNALGGPMLVTHISFRLERRRGGQPVLDDLV
jgi:hypothetical protein